MKDSYVKRLLELSKQIAEIKDKYLQARINGDYGYENLLFSKLDQLIGYISALEK